MNVGKPQRVHRVEPVKDPVPQRETPERRPDTREPEPAKLPAR